MSFSLETTSVQNVLGNSPQVQVYGWSHCYYEEIMNYLAESEDSPVEKVFTDCLGDSNDDIEERTTLQGRAIEQVEVEKGGPKSGHRTDKAGLTNLVFENYKREKEGLPIIPILFAIDIDDNSYPTTAQLVTSKDVKSNSRRTHSELRRAYKLVQEFGDVAEQSFKFVKLKKIEDSRYSVEQIDAPWKDSEWETLWAARKAQSVAQDKPKHWKKQLERLKKQYHKKRIEQLFSMLTTPQDLACSKRPLFDA